jgi:pimeloyl-ACP methyl ester carboxylesterase
MVTQAREFETQQVQVGQTQLYLLEGGVGPPCLVLHGLEGHEGWQDFHAGLAETMRVIAPSHPGYGHTERPDWITTVQHQAIFYHWLLQATDLSDVTLVGTNVGGWIAAYMAIMCPERLRRLVLVAPAGIKPERDETLDIFVTPWREVIQRGFANPDRFEQIYAASPLVEFGGIREHGRVMTMRMCFRPYLYDPALDGMLPKVTVPTLIVQGRNDRIMPLECAETFQRQIPRSEVRLLDQCGHFAHLDQPQVLAHIVREFAQ